LWFLRRISLPSPVHIKTAVGLPGEWRIFISPREIEN
jgi:hypothetical protein